MIKIIKKSFVVAVLFILSIAVISCEEDFTDIGSNVVSNTKFDTNAETVEITLENSTLEKIRTDNIAGELGQYLLGVYANSNYEKIEASVVSQVTISDNLKVVDDIYGADTTVVTKIDTVFIRIPFQATLDQNTSLGPEYTLDSIFGDDTKAFTLNVYRSNTFLNRFDPSEPSKNNKFYSNDSFEKTGNLLSSQQDYQFIPNPKDTAIIIKRRLFDDVVYTKDTVVLTSGASSTIPLVFAKIPLDKEEFKKIFLDEYGSTSFSSQTEFNNYFRGIILEATGTDGTLMSLNFNNQNLNLNPSIEVFYTNTILKSGNTVVDTISKNDRFLLSGIRVNTFKMEDKIYPVNEVVKVQGTAGSEAIINVFGADLNGNGIADKIEELRTKNWLINDASLVLYLDQSISPEFAPERLYMYKVDGNVESQIKDVISEAGLGGIRGFLETDESGNVEKYTFKITDYVSDILSGETNYSPNFKLKAYNFTDTPVSAIDTIFRNYSWNPKAVTLFNHLPTNGDKRAVLKISYSERQ